MSNTIRERLQGRRSLRCLALMATAAGACTMPSALQAFEFDTGNPNLRVRFDNQVRYAVGMRMDDIDPAFGNNPTYDETEYLFEKHDVMMNRFDLLSEFDVIYRENFGARVSAAVWHDWAYDGKAKRNPDLVALGIPGSYEDDFYTPETERFIESGGEILDAFVFANFEIGVPVKVRLGKHTVYWGESLFTPFHGIAYSQAPLDGLKSSSSPGIEAKEVFMPVSQVSASVQLGSQATLNAQYFFRWTPNRLPQGGTYFGSADMLFDGPEFIFAGPLGNLPQTKYIGPDKSGTNNFGVSLRFSPDALAGTSFGLYYRKFDETQPWAPVLSGRVVNIPGVGFTFIPSSYHLSYAEDTEMYAASVATSVGPVAVSSDLVYRHDTALVSASSFAGAGDLAGVEGARGNTWHWVVNGIYLLPSSRLWDSGQLLVEALYSKLDDVTKNEEVYKEVGRPGCTNVNNVPGQGTSKDGCSTGEYAQIQATVRPQWLGVAPSLDLSIPVTGTYGFLGNGPTPGPNFEDAYSWAVGLEFEYLQRYTVVLRYADSDAPYNKAPNGLAATQRGNAVQNDHGYLSLAFKTTF
jgi:hypothetical protein